MKFHSIGSSTHWNIKQSLFGTSLDSSEGISIVKYFKERGFITGSNNDEDLRDPIEFWITQPNEIQNIKFHNYGHNSWAFHNDPNYKPLNQLRILWKQRGTYSIIRRCFYGKDVSDYSFENRKKFFEAYKNSKNILDWD